MVQAVLDLADTMAPIQKEHIAVLNPWKQQEVEVTVLSNLLIAFFTMCSHIIPLQKDVRRVEFIGVGRGFPRRPQWRRGLGCLENRGWLHIGILLSVHTVGWLYSALE